MITGSINLSTLTHVVMEKKGKTGMVKGLFIPIEHNDLQEHDKGTFLNIVAFEMKEPKEWGTHIVKQSLPKEKREAMTEDEKNNMPIIGNLKTSSQSQANNNASPDKTYSENENGETDDLPF